MADTTIDLLKNSSYVGKMDELIAAVKLGSGATSDVEWDNVKNKPTTIGGYGIIDAKIDNGTITLGNQTITPLTSAPVTSVNSKTGAVTLSAADVSAIPSTLTGTAGQVLTKTADGQEWKDVDIPSGGGDNWKLLVDFESTEEIAANTGMVFDTADDGTPINAKEIIIDWYCPAATQSPYVTFKVNNVQCTGYAKSANYYFWSGFLLSNSAISAMLHFRSLTDVCLLTADKLNASPEPVWFAKTGDFETITSLQLTMFNGTYPVGLKIKILGR